MEPLKRTKIADILHNWQTIGPGNMINLKGWVRTKRGNKNVAFIALNDGSIVHSIQIVVDLAGFDEAVMKLITTGSCISVNGILVESPGQGQAVEIQAKEIEVYGTADAETYPLQKKGQIGRAHV